MKEVYSNVKDTITSFEKSLHETHLGSAYFQAGNNQHVGDRLDFVSTMDDFLENLNTRFVANEWIEAIDFTKFAIVGGCVLNALCRSPFSDTHHQDINIIYPTTDAACFQSAVFDTVMKLRRTDSVNKRHLLRLEPIPSTLQCFVHLSNGITLNFFNTPPEDAQNPLSHILHNFDMDISQVAFVGRISYIDRNECELFC